jgi:hypothetical protein
VRRTLSISQRRILASRFIPARAENTGAPEAHRRPMAVHPRACGEHDPHHEIPRPRAGSSPRVRRTPVTKRLSSSRRRTLGKVHDRVRRRRFIPARAENTSCTASPPRSEPVHPRTCGEHSRDIDCPCGDSGSSPRVHAITNHYEQLLNGSSPRVRRTLGRRRILRCSGRFIPARAENTAQARPRTRPEAVHPRACGEHRTIEALKNAKSGSSPRLPRMSPQAGTRFDFASINLKYWNSSEGSMPHLLAQANRR